jgi:hypothetical protein
MISSEEQSTPSPLEEIPSRNGGVSALASANAPFIYFDIPTGWCVKRGVVAITLETERHMTGPRGPGSDMVVVAHLRMTIETARWLKNTLQSVDDLVKEAERLRDAAAPGAMN